MTRTSVHARPRRVARTALASAAAAIGLLVFAASAAAHAELAESSPPQDARLAAPPAAVTLTFTEPVELLQPGDVEVVDSDGTRVSEPAATMPRDARVVRMALRPGLPEGTYTVRYQIIGADSHVIPGAFVFGIGPGELEEPYFAGSVSRGPSETGPWSVSARFLELVALGGLLGLIGFRWLVWAPAFRRAGPAEGERERALSWGRDAFWLGFGLLAVVAMLAEAYLLVVQTASALGVGVMSAVRDAAGIAQVLGTTSFGSLVQLRGGLLFGVFALGALLFIREYGPARDPAPPRPAGELVGTLVMTGLLLAVMGGLAAQGHPRVAPLPALQIGAQLVHLATVSVWMTGLALIAITLLRIPKLAPEGGPGLSAELLARFSRVALLAVVLALVTGVVRSASELGGPAELWETTYGRSIVYKLLLLAPIGALAMYNRRIVTTLGRVRRPNRATLRRVRRVATAELGLGLAVVVVASLLVAQVPGGS